MGRLLITYKDGHMESLKCKSSERALEIAENRRNVKDWKFYEAENALKIQKAKV